MFQYIHIGLIAGRQLRDSIRRDRNIIQYVNHETLATLLYFIEAEKAFDQVDWAYLSENRLGFGQSFLTWISLVYSLQEIEIFLDGYKSHPFQLYRGVRQGCLLSLILFNIIVETLALAVWA